MLQGIPAVYRGLRTAQAIEIQIAVDKVLGICDVQETFEKSTSGGRCLVLYRADKSAAAKEKVEDSAAVILDTVEEDCASLRAEKNRIFDASKKHSETIRVVEFEGVGEQKTTTRDFERLVLSELTKILDAWCTVTSRPILTKLGAAGVSSRKPTRKSVAAAELDDAIYEDSCHEQCASRLSRKLEPAAAPALSRLLRSVRESQQTVLVSGPPGAGKSALLARVARRFSALGLAGGWIVMKHFAGAGSSGGSSIRMMLRRFCRTLAEAIGEDVRAAAASGTAGELAQRLLNLIVRATGLMRLSVLLVVDGYDDMDADSTIQGMRSDEVALATRHDWIPFADVPGLTVVISICEVDDGASSFATSLRARTPEPLDVRISSPTSLTDLSLLASSALSELVHTSQAVEEAVIAAEGNDVLAMAAIRLAAPSSCPVWITAAVRALSIISLSVQRQKATINPLKVAEIIRAQYEVWSEPENIATAEKAEENSKNDSQLRNTRAGTATRCALSAVLGRIHKECGKSMTRTFFNACLCESARGMREADLQSLLGLESPLICVEESSYKEDGDASFDNWLPALRWARLRQLAAPLLRPANEAGEAVFRLADRGVREALVMGFDAAEAEDMHRHLALHLLRCIGGSWTPDGGVEFASMNGVSIGTGSFAREIDEGSEDLYALAGVARHLLDGCLWTDCVQVHNNMFISIANNRQETYFTLEIILATILECSNSTDRCFCRCFATCPS